MIGPLMFGFIMDHGAPHWVFGASVIVMIAVALVALVGDRRSARRRVVRHARLRRPNRGTRARSRSDKKGAQIMCGGPRELPPDPHLKLGT